MAQIISPAIGYNKNILLNGGGFVIDENWTNFTKTGNILDYLKYKENENKLRAENNATNNEGLSNKGTDYRGE